MDNVALRTSLITNYLTKAAPSAEYDQQLIDVMTENTRSARDFITSLNPDKRAIAIGRNDDIWKWDTQADLANDWTALTRQSALHVLPLVATLLKPQNILITNPDNARSLFSYLLNENKDSNITFVNNTMLYFYENFFRGTHECFNFGYSVVDPENLGKDSESGKYDFIYAYGWDVVSNLDYLDSLVKSLASGGALLVNVTNMGGKFYVDEFESHPHYDMHEFLLRQPDSMVFHLPSFYGASILVKM